LVVGLGVVFVLFGEGLHLVDSVHDTNERTPGHTGKRVAAGADLTVNLETTAETGEYMMSKPSLLELGAKVVPSQGKLTRRDRRSCSTWRAPRGTG
jgi:hypothetical protein